MKSAYAPSRLRLSKLGSAKRCAEEVRKMAREGSSEVADARRFGLRRLKRRKCARWLVPNWISKPSAVRPSGQAMTPALAMKILSILDLERKSAAQARTLSRELRSSDRRWTRSEAMRSGSAVFALLRSRAVR